MKMNIVFKKKIQALIKVNVSSKADVKLKAFDRGNDSMMNFRHKEELEASIQIF